MLVLVLKWRKDPETHMFLLLLLLSKDERKNVLGALRVSFVSVSSPPAAERWMASK